MAFAHMVEFDLHHGDKDRVAFYMGMTDAELTAEIRVFKTKFNDAQEEQRKQKQKEADEAEGRKIKE